MPQKAKELALKLANGVAHPIRRRKLRQRLSRAEQERRRKLLKSVSGMAAAGLVAGCSSNQSSSSETTAGGSGGGGSETDGSSGSSGGSAPQQLNVAGSAISVPAEPRGAKKFLDNYGVEISRKPVSTSPSDMINLFVAGDGAQKYDAVWIDGGLDDNGMEDLLRERGAVEKIDKSRIPNWDNIHPDYAEGGKYSSALRYPTEDGMELVGVPSVRNVDTVAYMKDSAPKPESMGALFDNDEFLGQTAILDDLTLTPLMAAMYMNNAGLADIDRPNNMTPDELKTVIDFLIERKKAGQFKTIWSTFEENVSLMTNNEVAYLYAYESSVIVAQNEGANVGYPALPETGCVPWSDNWLMTTGCVEKGREEQFYKLGEWSLSKAHGADMMQTRSYLPGIKTDLIIEHAESNPDNYDVERIKSLTEKKNSRYDVSGSKTRLNPVPDNLDAYRTEWQRFLNA